jgi:hypothetical protein
MFTPIAAQWGFTVPCGKCNSTGEAEEDRPVSCGRPFSKQNINPATATAKERSTVDQNCIVKYVDQRTISFERY